MNYLTDEQQRIMLGPINPGRVHQVQGMSHVEAYDIRAHLNRIFGFGRWSADVISMELIFEQQHENKNGKPAVTVSYRAGLRLAVRALDGSELATYTEYAAGDAASFPVFKRSDAHDFAMKTAESQALKRAAVNLGDQFGLSLYNNGSVRPLVIRTLAQPEEAPEDITEGAPDIAPEQAPDVEPEPVTQASPDTDWQAEIAQARNDRQSLLTVLTKAQNTGAPQEIVDQIIAEGKKLQERTGVAA